MRYFLELSVNGAVTGALYALAALSFVVVYKATRIMNFALGEFVMFAAGLVAAGANAMGLALVPALAFGGVGMFAVAAGFNRFVLRHLIGRPVIGMIMITIGFGAVLRAVAAFLFSGVPRDIDLPLPRGAVDVGGVLLSPNELAAAAVALMLIGAVSWFFARTRPRRRASVRGGRQSGRARDGNRRGGRVHPRVGARGGGRRRGGRPLDVQYGRRLQHGPGRSQGLPHRDHRRARQHRRGHRGRDAHRLDRGHRGGVLGPR